MTLCELSVVLTCMKKLLASAFKSGTAMKYVVLGFLALAAGFVSAQPCTPGAGQVAVYEHTSYRGACSVLDARHYTDSQAIGLANDSISSVRVGANTVTTLCENENFLGACSNIIGDDQSLADAAIGDNAVSSIRVLAGPADCEPNPGQVSFYLHGGYSGFCVVLDSGYYFEPQDMSFLNDNLTSVKVGAGAAVALYQHANFRGESELLYSSDGNLSNNVIGNDTVSSAIVYQGNEACYFNKDQVAVYAHINYKGMCSVLDPGIYRDGLHMGFPNDNISSIQIGSAAAARLCRHRDFAGTCEEFVQSDPDLTDNKVGNDHASSLIVGSKQTLVDIHNWAKNVLTEPSHFKLGTQVGARQDAVVVLWDPMRPAHLRPAASDLYNAIVGLTEGLSGYYRENSGGHFGFNLVGFFGWFTPPPARQGLFYWNYSDPNDSDGDGFRTGHTMRWVDAVRQIDAAGFDFGRYDRNGDGSLSMSELAVIIITPGNRPEGYQRPIVANQVTGEKLNLGGVDLTEILEIHPGFPTPNIGLLAHEFGHALLGLGDMYFMTWPPGANVYEWYHPFAARSYSIMANSGAGGHLDPVNKLKLGWATPQLVMKSGDYFLTDVETTGKVWVLLDPTHGYDEYFVLENRWRGTSFDRNLRDAGIAIWHVIEDPAINKKLPKPFGVDCEEWSKHAPGMNWERRAIRLIRAGGLSSRGGAIVSPLADDAAALWDIASGPVKLEWADGSCSGFTVRVFTSVDSTVAVRVTAP